MLPETVIFLMVISVVSCQINGEFWWLNSDIAKLQQGTAPPPNFDDVSELDTDETAKVIFREEVKKEKSLKNYQETINVIHFRDKTELAKPIFEFNEMNMNNKIWKRLDKPKNNSSQKNYDEFRFVFPNDDDLIWTENNNFIKKQEASVNSPKISQNGLLSHDKNSLLPEHICSFFKKTKCIQENGTIYEPGVKPNMLMNLPDTQTVCCILPISTTTIAKIIFPNDEWNTKRHKRSNVDEVSSTLKQRNNLLNRKHKPDNERVRGTTPATRKKVNQMVLNSDEYSIDPYWNIKNSNIRNPNIPSYQDPNTSYDYGSQNYGDDYTVELPKPGLVGLYSDHKQTQATWIHNKNKGYSYDDPDSIEEEDFETSFGYSTIDPRKDHRLTSTLPKPFRRRPQKLTSISSTTPDSELPNPIISFHSNPDFQLLQGFKLLNLVRHKNRLVRKTADINKESVNKDLEEEYKRYSYGDQKNGLFEANLKQKLFNECGKTQIMHDSCKNGEDQGQVKIGEHGLIAMVVLTKNERGILCYATLVHSRVAITAADCVYGKSPGAVSVIVGVQNLDEDFAQSQRRMATVYLDAENTPASLASNLALLHWLRPLKLGMKVQPACLGDPHVEDTCVFVGWGGYDQEMQSDLRWQRASILDPQSCNDMLSKLEVSDAFCATVQSRRTVTGVGGPLLCKGNGNERWVSVGVAASRNDAIIVLPLREWVMKTITSLRIL